MRSLLYPLVEHVDKLILLKSCLANRLLSLSHIQLCNIQSGYIMLNMMNNRYYIYTVLYTENTVSMHNYICMSVIDFTVVAVRLNIYIYVGEFSNIDYD